jgi:dihydrofolate reductase
MKTKKPIIGIIVVTDEGRAIGKNNQLLWDIPEDLAHFRQITSGHPVIMGEKTYRSLKGPLPNRLNIILSRQPDLAIKGCVVAHSIDEAFLLATKKDKDEIFVIGGGMIYKIALPYADKLYLTLVEGKHDADVFFPEYEQDFTKKISEEIYDNGKYKFKFIELMRK